MNLIDTYLTNKYLIDTHPTNMTIRAMTDLSQRNLVTDARLSSSWEYFGKKLNSETQFEL